LGGTSSPEERFQNFFKAFSETGELKYRQRLAQMGITGLKSLVVDFEDLMTFDRDLAEKLLENPDEYLKYAEKAVWAQMRFESPEYADEKRSFFARFRVQRVPHNLAGMLSRRRHGHLRTTWVIRSTRPVQDFPSLVLSLAALLASSLPCRVAWRGVTLAHPVT